MPYLTEFITIAAIHLLAVMSPGPDFAMIIKMIYGAEISLMTFVWFALVATALSQKTIKARFSAAQHHFEKVFGVILIALGIKVALSNSK